MARLDSTPVSIAEGARFARDREISIMLRRRPVQGWTCLRPIKGGINRWNAGRRGGLGRVFLSRRLDGLTWGLVVSDFGAVDGTSVR